MSSFIRKRRLTTSSTATAQGPSKKQRFIDVTRALLDIAKESSDACPPLKSCLGGINALIRHYDEIQDVKVKLEELIPWVTRLKDSLTKANTKDDSEEVERRTQLTKSLDDIEKRSRVLLEKGKAARIVDKARDAQAVVGLVDQLQKAILIYQMSQQQSIHNQVAQLTSSLGVFLKLDGKTLEVTGKINSVLARLDRLGTTMDGVGVGDEFKRRTTLFEALESIRDKLLVISDRSNTSGYQGNETDTRAVCKLAEVLRDAVVEYQFVQQRAIYDQNCRLIDAAELQVLNACPRARGAGYQHSDRGGCLTGTREAVLDEIESWTKDFDKSPVYWLNGLAGTGKSTIAQTTAERLFADGRLGASFFCSRNFKDRSDLCSIFPTLSFQLAYRYPNFRSLLIHLLRSNPDIGYESLNSQMERLIVTPLKDTGISTVIVIDALDECTDDEPQSTILSVMGRFVNEIPKVKFFITGRPEPRIQSGFRLKLLRPLTEIFILHTIEHSVVDADIRQFFKARLSELAQRFQLTGWPSDEHINILCQRAAGLFVYAVATIKFLDHKACPPKQQLNMIISFPEHTTYEGVTQFRDNTTLDSLYTSLLQMALDFGGEHPDLDSKVRSTIGAIVLLVNPLPPSAVAEIIGLEAEQVMMILKLVQSLLILDEDPNCPVKPFHKSFPDFITDPSRCLNKRLYISPGILHHELTMNCLRLMNDTLKPNLLLLPDYALNHEVIDLVDRVKSHISPALEYACKSWHLHLTKIEGDINCILEALHVFLVKKFLPWLEMISVLGAARVAVTGLQNLMLWLQKVSADQQFLDTARDYFHFVTKFFEVIKVSAPHIYHSALELAPKSSIVRKRYHWWFFRRFGPRVAYGLPSSWDQPATIIGEYESYTWSPCGQSFSVRTSTSVEVWDALTVEKRSTLQLTEAKVAAEIWYPHYHSPDILVYSPDGHSLAGCFGSAITIWDIQTSGVVVEIECKSISILPRSLVWSLDGTTIFATFPVGVGTWAVAIYDVALGRETSNTTLLSSIEPCLWQHKNTLCVMAMLGDEDSQATISILEIWPVFNQNTVESFSINLDLSGEPPTISFSPLTYWISAVTYKHSNPHTLFVFDIRDSRVLLQETSYFTANYLSPDGSLLVASGMCDNVYVWKYTPKQDYVLWKKFPLWSGSDDIPRGYRISPASSSMLMSRVDFLEVQHLEGPSTYPPAKSNRHYSEISPDGAYIVAGPKYGETITISNLYKNTSCFIYTGFAIHGLALTGNILLIEGVYEFAAWRLTAEGAVDKVLGNRIGDYKNKLWAKMVQKSLARFWVEGHTGVIEGSEDLVYFDTETGAKLELSPVEAPPPSSPFWKDLYDHGLGFTAQYSFSYHNFVECDDPSEGDLLVSIPWYKGGWVEYPEGEHRHRFWLPAHWRPVWDEAHWLDDATALRLVSASGLVVIKF